MVAATSATTIQASAATNVQGQILTTETSPDSSSGAPSGQEGELVIPQGPRRALSRSTQMNARSLPVKGV